MALPIPADGIAIHITAQPLTQQAFSPFGDVVSNPNPSLHPSSPDVAKLVSSSSDVQSANQGTAIRYGSVSRFRNLYAQAPSESPGVPTMAIFAVAERELAGREFVVRIMERHPYTTQTFTSLTSYNSSSRSPARYLVIVAPSLQPGTLDKNLPVPHQGEDLPGRGLPDVSRLRAFIATSDQGVTYGAGTWHAPMVSLGESGRIQSFQVVQFTSGVPEEDCQLVEFKVSGGESKGPDIKVRIPTRERLEKL